MARSPRGAPMGLNLCQFYDPYYVPLLLSQLFSMAMFVADRLPRPRAGEVSLGLSAEFLSVNSYFASTPECAVYYCYILGILLYSPQNIYQRKQNTRLLLATQSRELREGNLKSFSLSQGHLVIEIARYNIPR